MQTKSNWLWYLAVNDTIHMGSLLHCCQSRFFRHLILVKTVLSRNPLKSRLKSFINIKASAYFILWISIRHLLLYIFYIVVNLKTYYVIVLISSLVYSIVRNRGLGFHSNVHLNTFYLNHLISIHIRRLLQKAWFYQQLWKLLSIVAYHCPN